MPSYDFQCEGGHYSERFTRIADMPESVICEADVNGSPCGKVAPRVFMSPKQARDAQPIEPIVVYRKDDGGYIYPGDSGPRSYEGCERIELRTLGEVRRVTREQDRLDAEHWERTQVGKEAVRSERRAALMDRLSTQFGKDFARLAIETNERRAAQRRYNPSNYFEVAEFDRSNREPQRDARTGWKARHG